MPPELARTTRQQIAELLEAGELSFEALRQQLQLGVRELEDHLRHVQKSIHRTPKRLVIEPSRCLDCGYVFRGRERKRFHTPSRCPECRSEGVMDARFRIVG